MKLRFLFAVSALLLFTQCKKEDSKPEGTFITVNGDTRSIDTRNVNVETKVYFSQSNPPGSQYNLDDMQYSQNIAGLGNDELEIYVDIYDRDLSRSQYTLGPIQFSGTPKPDKAAIFIFLRSKNNRTPKSLYSKDGSGVINFEKTSNTIEFQNVSFDGGYKVSGRLVF